MFPTAEQIAKKTDDKEGLANIKAINKEYRAIDDSHLRPINNKFNATEKAIRKARGLMRHNGAVYGLEYCYMIEDFLTKIVNSEY